MQLIIIVVVLAVVIGAVAVTATMIKTKSKATPNKSGGYKRAVFFHKAEGMFYNQLKSQMTPEVGIFCKVRMIDVIEPVEANDRRSRNRIMQKHLDFVIVNTASGNVVAVIELDGRSHQRQSQQQRDQVKEECLRSAGVQIVRVNQNKYTIEEVMKELGITSARPPVIPQ